ncbi:mantle protein-like [Bombus huntii]|uniref:mantle protein-like n=1 Tax=Bombus huntii TaxID=85661 RepID=UPI0021AA1970|nr:mantle protein-like [Bombus huntii]
MIDELCNSNLLKLIENIALFGLAMIAGIVSAGHIEEDHGSSTYEEKTKPVEIPIYKKYGKYPYTYKELRIFQDTIIFARCAITAIPIPHPVPVEIPQKIEIPIPQPQQVPVEIPHPYPVEVVKHVEIPIEKPEPVIVEKHIPFVVEKPYPVYVEKKFPIPVAKPYPVHVPVYKHVFHYTSKGKGWH